MWHDHVISLLLSSWCLLQTSSIAVLPIKLVFITNMSLCPNLYLLWKGKMLHIHKGLRKPTEHSIFLGFFLLYSLLKNNSSPGSRRGLQIQQKRLDSRSCQGKLGAEPGPWVRPYAFLKGEQGTRSSCYSRLCYWDGVLLQRKLQGREDGVNYSRS